MLLYATHITLIWEVFMYKKICGIKFDRLPVETCPECETEWVVLPEHLIRHRYGFLRKCPICGDKKTFSAYRVPDAYLKLFKEDTTKVKGIMTVHD